MFISLSDLIIDCLRKLEIHKENKVKIVSKNKDRIKLKSLNGLTFITCESLFYTFKSQIVELKVNSQSFFIGWRELSMKNASRSK